MRHFLMIMKRCEIVHTIFEYFALYVALKSYYLAWYSINNQIHQKCLIWILIVCSKLLQQTFEFSRQKWQHHKCDSKYRFAHPLPLICDMNQENVLKTLPCTQLQSSAPFKWDTLQQQHIMLTSRSIGCQMLLLNIALRARSFPLLPSSFIF